MAQWQLSPTQQDMKLFFYHSLTMNPFFFLKARKRLHKCLFSVSDRKRFHKCLFSRVRQKKVNQCWIILKQSKIQVTDCVPSETQRLCLNILSQEVLKISQYQEMNETEFEIKTNDPSQAHHIAERKLSTTHIHWVTTVRQNGRSLLDRNTVSKFSACLPPANLLICHTS